MIKKLKESFVVANMTCHEASVLMANAEELELSCAQRFGLWMHLLICGTCRQFRNQMRFVKRLLDIAPADFLATGFARCGGLSAERSAQIKVLLRQAAEKE